MYILEFRTAYKFFSRISSTPSRYKNSRKVTQNFGVVATILMSCKASNIP